MSIRESTCGLLAAACAAMSLLLPPAHQVLGQALGSSKVELDPERVRWDRLQFQASHGLTSARSEVRVAPVAAARLKSSLLDAFDGPLPPLAEEDAMLMTATIGMTSKLPFIGDKVWETRVWFLPATVAALQRTRTKTGDDPDSKTFRYFPDGVRRVLFAPADNVQGGRRSESWTTVRNRFYAYGPARVDCGTVSDPSLLLYVLSALDLAAGDPPLELCVFNKKTLYRVELRAAESAPLPVRYTERRGTTAELVEHEAAVLTVVISSRPIAPAEQDPEPFEFFEMRGDVEVSLDPASRLPVRVRGMVENFGQATFDLVEVELVR